MSSTAEKFSTAEKPNAAVARRPQAPHNTGAPATETTFQMLPPRQQPAFQHQPTPQELQQQQQLRQFQQQEFQKYRLQQYQQQYQQQQAQHDKLHKMQQRLQRQQKQEQAEAAAAAVAGVTPGFFKFGAPVRLFLPENLIGKCKISFCCIDATFFLRKHYW